MNIKIPYVSQRSKTEIHTYEGRILRKAGFRNNDMELLMIYKKPTTVSEISLNFLIETETGIFPPQIIEVWGGSSEKNMKLLGKSKPLQPKELIKPFIQVSSCKINSYIGTHFKIISKPLNPIPN